MFRSAQYTPLTTALSSSRPLRRLTLDLFVVIALKIALLLLIWWALFAPQPKPDVSPAAISAHLAPTADVSKATAP